jgi:hypothetical protein
MAPPPRNTLELQLREEIDSALSGSCCSASPDATPLFVLSESETSFVNCQSGLPASEKDLFAVYGDGAAPSTYGEITILGIFENLISLPILTVCLISGFHGVSRLRQEHVSYLITWDSPPPKVGTSIMEFQNFNSLT